MRRSWVVIITSIAVGVIVAGYWVWSGLKAVATLQPGMVMLHLPSGATAYLRRQSYFGKPAEVYISANGDFCAPYDRWHDYKLPQIFQGGPETPVLISYAGDTVVVHSPEPLRRPWLAKRDAFNVAFQPLPPDEYAAYVGDPKEAPQLPKSWIKVEIPFGHNTCAL